MRYFSIISALCAFTAAAAPVENRADCGCGTELYRAVNPTTSDHFYTTNLNEYNTAVNKLGYDAEKVACRVYPSSEAGTVPFYRLRSGDGKTHFYTTDAAERASAIKELGYIAEVITGYVYTASTKDTVPLYRAVYELGGNVHHFYTTDKAEMDSAVKDLQYRYERIAAYVFPA